MINNVQKPSSLKEAIQGLVIESMAIIQGTIISENPLKIQIINDDKLILHENIICLPKHLATYKTTVDITLDKGSISSVTKNGQGTHSHSGSGEDEQTEGVSVHNPPPSEGTHIHDIGTFNISGASMTVYNELKQGETVYVLSFNYGKKYYILDREA